MEINPHIFREYDIRGVVDKDLTPDVVRHIGTGVWNPYGQLGSQRAGHWKRRKLSSKAFSEALIEGLTSTGCHVVDIGLCPTPVYYFSIFHLEKDGGMMVTGSHNPPDFNGFKVSVGKSTIFGEKIQDLRQLIEKGSFVAGKGNSSQAEVIKDVSELCSEEHSSREKTESRHRRREWHGRGCGRTASETSGL